MANYAIIRNAMTNATEADLMFFQNEFLYQKGVIDSASLAVTQRGAGANMSVDVAPGRAIILNAAWSLNSSVTKYWEILCDAVQNVAITSNATANPRIDNIVAYLNPSLPPDADGGGVVTVYAIAGTPAASPVAPATPSYCISLANVAVSAGAASIVTANITDTRTYANLYVPDGNAIYFDPPSDVGTLMYGGTSQTGTPTGGDGWRFTYDQGYNGGAADFFVFEKTDGNQTSPDGGFAFVMTGNDGIQEESLILLGDGTVEIHDGNHLKVYDSTDTDVIEMYHDGTDGRISSDSGDLILAAADDIRLVPSSNGNVVSIGRMPRDNSGSATYAESHIQRGWGYIVGDGTNTLNETVTFPVSFSSEEVTVIISVGGARATAAGTPDNEGWFTPDVPSSAQYSSLTATGFRIDMYKASGTFSPSSNYNYSWIAIGPL